MSIQKHAHELTQIQKELMPLIKDIRALLEQETEEIPIYKIEQIIPLMMVRYCKLRNQEIATKRLINVWIQMNEAEKRYKEKKEEEEEEEEEKKEEKKKKEEKYIKMISTDSDDSPFNFPSDDDEKEEDEEKKEEKEKEEEK